MQINKPDYYNDLEKTYSKIWNLLEEGLKNRDSSFHIPVFICGVENSFDGRIIVLRGINKLEKKIHFHTDIRSNKVKFLKLNSKSTLLFYDKIEKIQLRIKAKCEVNYNNQVTKVSWEKTGHISRKCYLVNNDPGTKSDKPTSGLDSKFDNFEFTKEESESGYKNFCVIKCKIKSIEWLYLAAKGHRRALIELNESKKFTW